MKKLTKATFLGSLGYVIYDGFTQEKIVIRNLRTLRCG
jgi:hypothetical protein